MRAVIVDGLRPEKPRRKQLLAVTVAIVTIGLWQSPLSPPISIAAQPPVSDQFNTSGRSPTPNTDFERKQWGYRASASDDYRTQTKNCLQILDEARSHELRSYELQKQLNGLRGTPQFATIHRESGRESQIAFELIGKFHKCASWQRVERSDEINTGGNPDSQGDRFDSRGMPIPAPGQPFGDEIRSGGYIPPSPPHQGGKKICDLRRLAMLVKERYARPGKPLASYEVLGFGHGAGKPGAKTFLLVAQGVDNKDFWNYWLAQIARAYSKNAASPEARAVSNTTRLIIGDGYTKAILAAIQSLPPGSNLILAGHSLGAIEQQHLVAAIKQHGFGVPYVVTFGAPIVAAQEPGTLYRYIKADADLIAGADRIVGGSADLIRIAGGDINPWNLEKGSHHIYWNSPDLEQRDIFGDRKSYKSPCLEIDLLTVREYAAPGLAEASRGPRPLNEFVGCLNCFWAAIAFDMRLANPGQPFRAPPSGPAYDPDIERTLRELYGNDHIVPSSKEEIQDTLCNGGVGSRGLVFVKIPGKRGHVFNARCVASSRKDAKARRRVVFYDAQRPASENDPHIATPTEIVQFGGNPEVRFFRTR